MKFPAPYFGGKTAIADKVWSALGNPAHFIEPFCGSGAVLLNRPGYSGQTETVCELDGHVANVWRALQFAPHEVAKYCDWPVLHVDLNARRRFMNAEMPNILERLTNDPEFFDARMAGYWIWSASCWIGSGLTCINAIPHISHSGKGIHSKIPLLSHIGTGIHSKIPHISDGGMGI